MAQLDGSPTEDVHLLGINLSSKSRTAQLLICGGGFFFGYLVNGLAEEFVYNKMRFSYGWYFSIVHLGVYLLLIYGSGFRLKQIQNPWSTYVQMSAVLAGSHGLTKGSLAYLNYPAQLMFKSTKVLPVMLLGSCIPGLRRTYGVRDYMSAVILVFGLILFTLADASTSPIFSLLGVFMVCGALLLDALVGNLQEAIFTINPGTSQTEMLFCSSVMGLFFLFVPCLFIELFEAFARCLEHPFIYGVLVVEACATYIGQMAVLSLVILFGAATTAMVTTARKAVTLTLSYIVFSKPFSGLHLVGMVLIATGIVMKMLPESKTAESKQKSDTPEKSLPDVAYTKVSLSDEPKELEDVENGEKEKLISEFEKKLDETR